MCVYEAVDVVDHDLFESVSSSPSVCIIRSLYISNMGFMCAHLHPDMWIGGGGGYSIWEQQM